MNYSIDWDGPGERDRDLPVDCVAFQDAFDALELLHQMDSAKAMRLACEHYGISIDDGARLLQEADALSNGNT